MRRDTKRIRRIKSLLVHYGITGVDIARELDVSPITVNVVIGGYGTSRRIQKEIWRQLKRRAHQLSYEELWGTKKKSKAA